MIFFDLKNLTTFLIPLRQNTDKEAILLHVKRDVILLIICIYFYLFFPKLQLYKDNQV